MKDFFFKFIISLEEETQKKTAKNFVRLHDPECLQRGEKSP